MCPPQQTWGFRAMLKRVFPIALTIFLAANFLVASTILTGTIARHAQHHGHDKHSHSQSWCGWMCGAGQAIEVPAFSLALNPQPIGWAFTVFPSLILLLLSFSPGSRDPPFANI